MMCTLSLSNVVRNIVYSAWQYRFSHHPANSHFLLHIAILTSILAHPFFAFLQLQACYSHLNSGSKKFNFFQPPACYIHLNFGSHIFSTFFNCRLAPANSTLIFAFFGLFFKSFVEKSLSLSGGTPVHHHCGPQKTRFYTKIQETSIKDKQYQSAFCLFL